MTHEKMAKLGLQEAEQQAHTTKSAEYPLPFDSMSTTQTLPEEGPDAARGRIEVMVSDANASTRSVDNSIPPRAALRKLAFCK